MVDLDRSRAGFDRTPTRQLGILRQASHGSVGSRMADVGERRGRCGRQPGLRFSYT